jgi:hypothetical protein
LTPDFLTLSRRIAGKPDPALFARTREPHALGWILVSAVYEGFVNTYVRRTRDLLRLATGGSGRLPEGDLHPDLIARLTNECVRTAQSVLSMCIRATDYLPPVDPTFSNFLRAMVTADFELNRSDDSGLRADMIEAFRQRGIHPKAVGSLAVPSLILEAEPEDAPPDPVLADVVKSLLGFGARQLDRNYSPPRETTPSTRRSASKVTTPREWIVQQNSVLRDPELLSDDVREISPDEEPEAVLRDVAKKLGHWAKSHRTNLRLDAHPDYKVAVRGFHPVHRIAASGALLLEMVVQIVQTRKSDDDLGGLQYRAGVTVIANIDGQIRYLIDKRFHDQELRDWVKAFDDDHGPGWQTEKLDPNRITAAFSARAMDRERWR